MSALKKEEILQYILCAQHITAPAEKLQVCRDLNGLQAQYVSNARHALQIRCSEVLPENNWGDGLVKSWTIRGTMHVFCEDDLPLFLHKGRANALRDVDRWVDDACISAERKRWFAEKILEWIAEGIETREDLKVACFSAGMTGTEAESVFNSWGGTLRALAEEGRIAYIAQEKKAFRCCKPFVPMPKEEAELELIRRYFFHYGPATLRDAAYYFGAPQTVLKQRMRKLPLIELFDGEQNRYCLESFLPSDLPDIPSCVFLAGFDPLLLGYRKENSLFLPQEYLRAVFNLTGIVFPTVMLQGRIKAKWKLSGQKLLITPFETLNTLEKRLVADTAERTFGELRQITWVE
ncbi:MAG: winged helix DNA-binding domain-containing protein [Clostridia bacterium]|nr:winged helix DNA-binding domain-containing protein [Clostridia bacterium]